MTARPSDLSSAFGWRRVLAGLHTTRDADQKARETRLLGGERP